jgi:hypothetical protein
MDMRLQNFAFKISISKFPIDPLGPVVDSGFKITRRNGRDGGDLLITG